MTIGVKQSRAKRSATFFCTKHKIKFTIEPYDEITEPSCPYGETRCIMSVDRILNQVKKNNID